MTLQAEGLEVRVAATGRQALDAIQDFTPDIVVLDIMMPGLDGMEVMRRVRDRGNTVPILFLTAKDALADRVAGIGEGGDDYVTKPFSLEELVVRVRALLRRSLGTTPVDEEPVLRVADLELNEQTHDVTRAGERIALTGTEFELLRFLMQNQRRVLSKAQLLDEVWGYDFGGKTSVVELYISYLRKKIDAGRDPLIHTLRGVGYTIREDA
jgi:two-component system OmpR family response regulator